MPTPPKIIHLDELDSVPGPGTLTWRPVRLALGIRAFGCNAYTAPEAGQDVVELHSEDPKLAHEELYFVAAGRASFTIDGEMHDAPAGTYVFVSDPAAERHAVAAEANTTVLSFGGPPTFEPSAWEWAFRATPLIRSDPGRAREILEDGLRVHPEAGALYYNLACVEALSGSNDQALSYLEAAMRRGFRDREAIDGDHDLAGIRGLPEFHRLVNLYLGNGEGR